MPSKHDTHDTLYWIPITAINKRQETRMGFPGAKQAGRDCSLGCAPAQKLQTMGSSSRSSCEVLALYRHSEEADCQVYFVTSLRKTKRFLCSAGSFARDKL